MSKYTKKRIDEIRELVTDKLPNAIKNDIEVNDYLSKYRVTLNLTVIQAVFGAEFEPEKKSSGYKVKYKHKPACQSELVEISRLLHNFIESIEKPYMHLDFEEDDMSIPVNGSTASLPTLEKVSNKKIKGYIFENHNAVAKAMLNGMDVFELAMVSEKIRKHKMRNIAIIVGGIALVATGGIVAASIINKKKKDDDIINDDINIDDSDINDIDDVDVDIDNDIPNVELD